MSTPTVTAGPTCAPPLAPWRSGWTHRHTLVAAMLAPALWWFFSSSAGHPATIGWFAVFTALAVGGALTLATYLPASISGRTRGVGAPAPSSPPVRSISPCAIMPALTVVLAGLLLSSASATGGGALLALLAVLVGLVQRTTGRGSCG